MINKLKNSKGITKATEKFFDKSEDNDAFPRDSQILSKDNIGGVTKGCMF